MVSDGSLNTTAAQDQNQSAGRHINQITGGNINQDIAADLIQAIASKVAQTVTGNIDQTTASALTLKGRTVWIGSPTINILALLSSFMGATQSALNTLASHTHPKVSTPTQQTAVAANATSIGNTKATLDRLRP